MVRLEFSHKAGEHVFASVEVNPSDPIPFPNDTVVVKDPENHTNYGLRIERRNFLYNDKNQLCTIQLWCKNMDE